MVCARGVPDSESLIFFLLSYNSKLPGLQFLRRTPIVPDAATIGKFFVDDVCGQIISMVDASVSRMAKVRKNVEIYSTPVKNVMMRFGEI